MVVRSGRRRRHTHHEGRERSEAPGAGAARAALLCGATARGVETRLSRADEERVRGEGTHISCGKQCELLGCRCDVCCGRLCCGVCDVVLLCVGVLLQYVCVGGVCCCFY